MANQENTSHDLLKKGLEKKELKDSCIVINIRYDQGGDNKASKTCHFQHMLWELANPHKRDFLNELQNKMKLGDLKNYNITCGNSLLLDQEDFCGALLKILSKDSYNMNDKIVIEIRNKV